MGIFLFLLLLFFLQRERKTFPINSEIENNTESKKCYFSSCLKDFNYSFVYCLVLNVIKPISDSLLTPISS